MHEKRTGSAGVVEHANAAERGGEIRSAGCIELRGHTTDSAPPIGVVGPHRRAERVDDCSMRAAREQCLAQCFVAHSLDDRRRCVERARHAAVLAGHERFERTAEHFRVHCGLAPGGRLLTCRHAVAAQQPANQRADRLVCEADVAIAALESRPCKQPAVEKGQPPERHRRARSSRDGCIQRAKEERLEQPPMHLAAARALRVEHAAQKPAIAIEPPLGFEKRQEQES